MSKNANLSNAKKAKNDEFYTRLEDIEKELNSYDPKVFKDKVIFCNCDDPTSSNFWNFFHMNFNRLGLEKLISTHYNMDGSPSYKMEYASKDPKDDVVLDKGIKKPLRGNGDFRSDDCIKLLKQSDLVVTNPPFSLFREYVAQLKQYNKEFIIWGNNNAITYKEIFPLIKEGKMWLGYCVNKTCYFRLSHDYPKWDEKFTAKMHDGNCYGKVPAISTFTIGANAKKSTLICILNMITMMLLKLAKSYKFLQIPLDYTDIMGVPITFLDKYSPDQFEILGITDRQNTSGLRTKKYMADDSKKYNDLNARGVVIKDGKYKAMYARILVRNKHPEDYMNDAGNGDDLSKIKDYNFNHMPVSVF